MISAVRPFLPLSGILAGIAVLFWTYYSLPFSETLAWYLAVLYFFYIPGSLLLRWLKSARQDVIAGSVYAIALGMALIPVLYGLARRINSPWLFQTLMAIMFVVWLRNLVSDIRSGERPVQVSRRDFAAWSLLMTLVIILLHLTYFTDLVFTEEGLRMRNIYLTETDFHLGVVNMLKDTFPPLFPYASGKSLAYYHVSMHLEIEMVNRYFSVDTGRLVYFYFPLLYVCLLVSLPYFFIRSISPSVFFGAAAGVLMFGADLSFIPGFLGIIPPDYPWSHLLPYPWTLFFRTTLWSVLCLNGILPAMITMTLGLIHLNRYIDTDSGSHAAVFGLLGYAAFGFKSSMGLHMMAAAFITGLAGVVFRHGKDRTALVICLVSLSSVLLMTIDLLFVRGGVGNTVVHLDLLHNFYRAMSNLRLQAMPGAFYPVMFLFYLLATFGGRAFGFIAFVYMAKQRTVDRLAVYLVVFTVIGFIAAESLYLGNSFRVENNSEWFAVQSLMGGWLLTSYCLVRSVPTHKQRMAAVLICLLAIPSTIQFLSIRFDERYYDIDGDAMAVVRYLEKTPAGSVVLHLPVANGPSLAANLAGRPSVISMLHSHAADMLGEHEYGMRLQDVDWFFSFGDSKDRMTILRKYQVAFVYAPTDFAKSLEKEPFLTPVLRNGAYVVFKVILPQISMPQHIST